MKILQILILGLFVYTGLKAQNNNNTKQVAEPGQQFFEQLLKRQITLQGEKIEPGKFEGKYVALFFSAISSPSSKLMAMNLYALQKKNEVLSVIKISHGNGEAQQIEAEWKGIPQTETDLSFVQVLDKGLSSGISAVNAYKVTEFPSVVLLDESRKVISRYTGTSFAAGLEMYKDISQKITSAQNVQDRQYISDAAALSQKFYSLEGTEAMEKIIKDSDLSNPYISKLQGGFQSYLVTRYARTKNLKKANYWLGQIHDEQAKQDAAVQLALIMYQQHNYQESRLLLESLMDRILSGAINGKLKPEKINDYSKLTGAYCKLIPMKGNEASYIRYLKPIFDTCRFFPADGLSLKEKPGAAPDSLQVFHYAKALAATLSAVEVAEVLASYLQAEPASRTTEFLRYFKEIPGLAGALTAFKARGDQRNYQSLYKLCLKPDVKGKVWGLEGINSKYILLDFWGSWCGPCRASHPHLKEVYAKYKSKGLEMIGIAYEPNKDLNINKFNWKRAIAQDGTSWIQLLNQENQEQFEAFTAFGDENPLVKKYLYDREGNLLGRFEGKDAEGLDRKLAELMP